MPTSATGWSERRSRLSPARPHGFSLLELLVVMVILGMLAGYVAPKYFAQIGKSETNTARAQIEALEKALDMFRIDTGRYPTSEEGLLALMQQPADENRWSGPYLKKDLPRDPWGRPYIYRQPGSQGDYELFSLGKDGRPGGSAEAADVRGGG